MYSWSNSSSEGCEYADDHDESPDQKSESRHEGVHNENIDASWAEAMAKILNKKTQQSKPTILLKNKELERIKEKEKQEQAEKQKKICERRDWELIARVKPNIVQDREREKNLQRIATRGVVQLFNAVRKHQKNVDEKLTEAGGSERKKAKMLSSVTKKDFINVLRGNMSDNPHATEKNKPLVFKLSTAKQQDHYFQAAYLEERDTWVKDIRKAIKCLEEGCQFARKSTRKSIRLPEAVNLGTLYLSMKDPDSGVRELKLEKDKKVFNHCFTGTAVIDWLMSNNKVRNRQEGLILGTALISEGYLQPAGDLSKAAIEDISETTLLDQIDAFYYFADSGFYCEGNSSDEDVVLKEEFRGAVVKQGCLLKQGDEDALGAVHLRGSVVTAIEYVPDAKKYEVEGNLFEVITADETHYFLQAATPDERKEWIQAIQSVAKSGK
ncbi:PLEK protein, partial [Polypterus senegalus]